MITTKDAPAFVSFTKVNRINVLALCRIDDPESLTNLLGLLLPARPIPKTPRQTPGKYIVNALRGEENSLLPKHQIQRPASFHMRPRPSAMAQDFKVRAARFFESVGKDRQAVKCSVLVDRLSEFRNRPVVPCEPCLVDGNGAERVPEDVTKQVSLATPFRCHRLFPKALVN